MEPKPTLADEPLLETVARLPWLQGLLWVTGLLLVAILAFVIARIIVVQVLTRMAQRTRTRWDNILLEHGVFRRLTALVPLVILEVGIDLVPHLDAALRDLLHQGIQAGMTLVGALTAIAFFSAVNTIYCRFEMARERPIKGYIQIVQIVIGILAGMLIIAQLTGTSPWGLLSGLGAMTAVLLLIFRDTILSLVASMQLIGNKLVRVGDWIEVPRFGADGSVIDIALHTVKVQNWDRTIVTIPTHSLIEGSFINWRGMQDAGGRRIKRHICIDMRSIHFLSREDLEHFRRFTLLNDYINTKVAEIEADNASRLGDKDLPANIRNLTNIGTLRAYIAAYLHAMPTVRQDMTFLIRQLQPGPAGLPLEIYIFTNTTAWADYEAIQSDIFDHLLAVIPAFGLRVFQQPSGDDLERALTAISGDPSPHQPQTTSD